MTTKRSWYRMTAAKGDAPAEIAIYDEIGFWGINAADFRNDLKALGAVEAIDLRINSPGGEVFDALAMFNMLAAHPARIVAYIDGWAASAASLVAMAGDEVLIAENAWLMIHNPWVFLLGDAEDLRKKADLLDSLKLQAIRIYQRHSDLSDEEIAALMDAETWMESTDAVANGFATGTFAAAAVAASATFDPARYTALHAPPLARRILQPPPAAPVEENTMKPKTTPAPPADSGNEDPTPANTPTPDAAQLAADRAALAAERQAIQTERLAARRERLEAAVNRDLEQLGSRLSPAMRRAGTRDKGALAAALVELRLADEGPTITATIEHDGQEAEVELPAYEVVLAALQAAPEFTALGAGELANDDDPDAPRVTDQRTPEERAFHKRVGLSDDRVAELATKFPNRVN